MSAGPGCRNELGARLGGAALLAMFESVAFAVHVEDLDVMSEPIQQCADEALGAGPRSIR